VFPRQPDSLRARLSLLLLAAVLPPIAVLAWVAHVQRGHTEVEARDRVQSLVRAATLEHAHAVDGVRQLVMALSDLPELVDRDADASAELLTERVNESKGLVALAVFDREGRVRAATGAVPNSPDHAAAPWFGRALRGTGCTLGDPGVASPLGGAPGLVVASALHDRSGRRLGVLVAWMRLQWTRGLAQELAEVGDGVLPVFDRTGALLDPASGLDLAPAAVPTGHELVRVARARVSGVATVRGFDGEQRLYAFAPLESAPEHPMWVAVGLSQDAALAVARSAFERSLAVLALLGIGLLWMGWTGVRRMVLEPVEGLLRVTRRVANGDPVARVGAPYVRGELGELARAFDEMIASLDVRRNQRDRAESDLRDSEALKNAVFEAAPDAILTFDHNSMVLELNGAAERLLAVGRHEAVCADLAALLLPTESREEFRRELRSFLDHRESAIVGRPLEWRVRRSDGSEFPGQVTITPILHVDRPPIFSLYLRDLTDHRRHVEALHAMSLVDDLTGLYNRRGFLTFAAQQLRVAGRLGKRAMLVVADLDDLKEINDTWGHAEGDRALVEAAHVLRATYRTSDVIARIGGDEFVVLALDTSGVGEERSLQRLQERIASVNETEGRRWPLSISTGATFWYPSAPRSIETLLAEGDATMYQHKRERRRRRAAA
jgi:diguanylate cyclase (GGDEF)-like protein/PAS domain S-box-containing protein